MKVVLGEKADKIKLMKEVLGRPWRRGTSRWPCTRCRSRPWCSAGRTAGGRANREGPDLVATRHLAAQFTHDL